MKQAIIQAGPYAGKEALILGEDSEYLGTSIFGASDRDLTTDYMKRLALEPVSTFSKVYICNVEGKLVALNQYELTGKEK
jgi:hypothetical protein